MSKPKATPGTEKTKSQPQSQPKPDFFQELFAPAGVRHPLGSGIPKNHPLAKKD